MLTPPKPKSFLSFFKKRESDSDSDDENEEKVKEEVVLQPFIADKYFKSVDSGVKKNGQQLKTLSISPDGIELAAEYYHDKYQANISIIPGGRINFANVLKDVRANPASDVRATFIIYEAPPSKHVYPLIFIREKGEDAILLADSLGVERETSNAIAQQIGLPVYAVRASRQSSQQGCVTDALVFGRDSTGMHGGKYIIPDLLARLKKVGRSTQDSPSTFNVKLPDELLKTSQISVFNEYHREREEKEHIIHKGETLSQFLSRYSDKDVTVTKDDKEIKKDSVPNYMRVKGLKLGKIIEAEFYIKQFKAHMKSDWNNLLHREFLARVKADVSGSLHTVAVNFLNEKMKSHSKIEIVIHR